MQSSLRNWYAPLSKADTMQGIHVLKCGFWGLACETGREGKFNGQRKSVPTQDQLKPCVPALWHPSGSASLWGFCVHMYGEVRGQQCHCFILLCFVFFSNPFSYRNWSLLTKAIGWQGRILQGSSHLCLSSTGYYRYPQQCQLFYVGSGVRSDTHSSLSGKWFMDSVTSTVQRSL